MKNYFQNRMIDVQNRLKDGEVLLLTPSVEIYYLTGFTGDDSCMVITKKSVYFITDGRYTEQIKQEKQVELSVEETRIGRKLMDVIVPILQDDSVKTLLVSKKDLNLDFYEELTAKTEIYQIKIENTLILREMRIKKDEYEIEIIKQNLMITELGYHMILPFVEKGKSETEIAAELEYFLRKKGAKKTSFDTIIGSGFRSALPHGTASTKKVEDNEIILFDFGIFKDGYCSDFTRCYYFGKMISPKIQEIHGIVLDALKVAQKTAKPGIPVSDVHKAAYDCIKSAGYEKSFWHSTGHGVGLEIHEAPRVSFADSTILEEGMVVTIEPGIYLPELGGIRLEDMIVIRKNGCEVLTKTSYNL